MATNIIGNVPNKNRTIDITPTDTTGHSSWRNNLSSLLNKGGSDPSLISGYSNDYFNVDDNVHLLMDKEPKVFSSKNQFGSPVNEFLQGNGKASAITSTISGLFNAGSAILNGITGEEGDIAKTWQPWGRDVIAWTGARGGIEFDYVFNFTMGQYGLWNALEEVVKPVLNLVAPALPRHLDAITMTGPFPNVFQLLVKLGENTFKTNKDTSGSEIPPSPDGPPQDVPKADQSLFNEVSSWINNILLNTYKEFTYTVKFGNIMTFEKILIKDAKANFSNQVDQYGWPVSGSAEISFAGMVPISLTANKELMVTRFGGGR